VSCVPLPIRQEAAKRQETEGNRLSQEEAYLDLIDLKTIMERNWGTFEAHFTALGQHGGKGKCLAFMDGLNEVRRLIGHPLEMHVSGYEFSLAEKALLKEVDRRAQQLAARVRRRPHPP
jgi:hypothetical protein